jgi:histidinol-phosphate aminotransferase
VTFPPLRDDLGDLEGYHSAQVDVPVRLNTNESPYAPPEAFVREWAEALAVLPLHRYPDRRATALRATLAEFLGQPASRVFAATGSNEVLQSLLLAYGGAGRTAAVFEPSYLLHAHIARVTGTTVVSAPRADDFHVDLDAARALLAEHRPAVTFLCSPNNPTGTVELRETVEALLDAAPGLLVVDEAYGEFADWSALDLLADDAPLVVVRTFSKVWSLAAVRLGFCVAPPQVVGALDHVVLPYHLGAPAQLAGTLALPYRAEMDARVAAVVAERERLVAGMAGLDGIEVVPSGANFVLFRPPGQAAAVWQALVERGVLVRDVSGVPGVEGRLRVTVGTPEENDAFLGALKEVTT